VFNTNLVGDMPIAEGVSGLELLGGDESAGFAAALGLDALGTAGEALDESSGVPPALVRAPPLASGASLALLGAPVLGGSLEAAGAPLVPSDFTPGRRVAEPGVDRLRGLGLAYGGTPAVLAVAALPAAGTAPSPPPLAAGSALETGVASRLFASLRNDPSPLALCPRDPQRLERVVSSISHYLSQAYAPSTIAKDRGYFRTWERICASLGTSAWRTDVAANTGRDPHGFQREQVLQCIALIEKWADMQPRSHSSPGALPGSAMSMLGGVRRTHTIAGLSFAPSQMAAQVLKGMLREYVRIHKLDGVAPERKCAFPHEVGHNVLLGLLRTPDGSSWKSHTVDYSEYRWRSARAAFETAAETGNRGDELRRFTFASLVWKIGGREVAAPSDAQLASLGEDDGVWLKHSTSKSDPFGFFFATTPSFLAFSRTAPRCACRRLAALERFARVEPGLRASTPLFGMRLGAAFTYEQMRTVLDVFLVCGARVPEADLVKYSVHSFRITLATLLFALKCSIDTIKRMLRWRSDDSVRIYGRLSDAESGELVAKSLAVHVDSRVAPRLVTVPIDININAAGAANLDAAIEADVDAVGA
jgi:hypothetical protein